MSKFKYLFNRFYSHLHQIEQQFHPNKLKITKYLKKLKENCNLQKQNSRSFDRIKIIQDQIVNNKPIPKPFVRSISVAKPSQTSKQLKSIEEEEDEYRTPIHERRIETAGTNRRRTKNNQKIQFRPRTGKVECRRRYYQSEKASKTINLGDHVIFNTEQSNSLHDGNRAQYILDDRQIQNKRKRFYEDLERQKSKQGDCLSQRQRKQIFKRYTGKANQRLWQKINRLI